MSKPTRIIIAGDLFPMPCNYSLFEKGDIQTLFGSRLCEMFASADMAICNLEGCFTDGDTPIEKYETYDNLRDSFDEKIEDKQL